MYEDRTNLQTYFFFLNRCSSDCVIADTETFVTLSLS